jgi:hypothetical protein
MVNPENSSVGIGGYSSDSWQDTKNVTATNSKTPIFTIVFFI